MRKNARDRSNSGRADSIALLAFTTLGFLTGWVVVEYLHNIYLQEYLSGIIRAYGSGLRIAAPLGVLVVGVAVFLRSRRNRLAERTSGKSEPLLRGPARPKVSHPLFLVERPSRDSSFVFRKTRSSGRISRVRSGERLPPGEEFLE